MTTFESFLSGTTTFDYVLQDQPYDAQIERAAALLSQADSVLIGAGSGMSTAGGAQYGGEWFKKNFAEFQERYGQGPYFSDMYAAGFYPFPSQEAFWGYWSKHALLGCIDLDTTPLHRKLLEAVGSDNYFVLTTNVDRQFEKAGVPQDKIFATQGSYTHIQCARGCHQKTYDATKLFLEMNARRQGTEIPSALVPHCPVCGGPMAMNLRQDNTFVEDDDWHRAEAAFSSFLDDALEGNLVLLEVGCGFNTPTIVRFPFEKLCRQHKNVHLIRLNLNEAIVPQSISAKSVCINADMAKSITDLAEAVAERKSES